MEDYSAKNEAFSSRIEDLGFGLRTDCPFGHRFFSLDEILMKSRNANLLDANYQVSDAAKDFFEDNLRISQEGIKRLIELSLFRHYGGASQMDSSRPASKRDIMLNLIPYIAFDISGNFTHTKFDNAIEELSQNHQTDQASAYLALAGYFADKVPEDLSQYVR